MQRQWWNTLKTIIDANVILRYLLDDHQEMADQAEQIIRQGAETLPEIVAEVVYVLGGVYKMGRKEIKECILAILSIVDVEHYGVMVEALNLFEKENLDFVDCILIAYQRIEGRTVFSFDKKVNKILIK